MASAEKRVERRVIEDVTISLKLTADEAETLIAVLALTAGDRKESPREHVVSILDAFRRTGMHSAAPLDPTAWRLANGNSKHPSHLAEGVVRFRDYPAGA